MTKTNHGISQSKPVRPTRNWTLAMITILTDDVLQANLSVQDVVDYVLEHDWQPRSQPNENILVFVGPLDDEGNEITLILPANDVFTDKDLRITEAVYLLADIAMRYVHSTGKPTPTEIIDEIIAKAEEKQSATQQVP